MKGLLYTIEKKNIMKRFKRDFNIKLQIKFVSLMGIDLGGNVN